MILEGNYSGLMSIPGFFLSQIIPLYKLAQEFFLSASSVSRLHTSKLCPHPPQTISHLSGTRDFLAFNCA
jgi:hypothetical protein